MALFRGLACGSAMFEVAETRDVPFASIFAKLAALVKRNWRQAASASRR